MIIITLDALALPADDLGARQPRAETRRLWNALFPYYHGRLIVLADGIPKEGRNGETILLEWLKREGYKATLVDMSTESGSETKHDRVVGLNSVYGKIHWFIDVDPETVAKVARYGIPTLLVTVPDTVRPEWSTGREMKGWDVLVEEIESQELAKKERSWGEIE